MEQNSINNKKRLKEILEILVRNDINKSFTPKKLKLIIKGLGPYFINLGQILSNEPNILPKQYRKELASLSYKSTPISYSELQKFMIEKFHSSLNDLFLDLEAEPFYVSPLYQSHRAILKNSSMVRIKIQNKNAYNEISRDISLTKKAIDVLKLNSNTNNDSSINFAFVIDELWAAAQRKLNFLQEAKNTEEFYDLNSNIKYIRSPRIHEEYSGEDMLTLDYIQGTPISEVDKMEALGYDLKKAAINLGNNFIKQIIIDGVFKHNPNENDTLINNQTIIWLNFNTIDRLEKKEKIFVNGFTKAIVENNIEKLKSIFLLIDDDIKKFKTTDFEKSIGQISNKSFNSGYVSMEMFLKDCINLFNKFDIKITDNISNLCNSLVSMDNIIRKLNSNLSLGQITKSYILPNKKSNTKKSTITNVSQTEEKNKVELINSKLDDSASNDKPIVFFEKIDTVNNDNNTQLENYTQENNADKQEKSKIYDPHSNSHDLQQNETGTTQISNDNEYINQSSKHQDIVNKSNDINETYENNNETNYGNDNQYQIYDQYEQDFNLQQESNVYEYDTYDKEKYFKPKYAKYISHSDFNAIQKEQEKYAKYYINTDDYNTSYNQPNLNLKFNISKSSSNMMDKIILSLIIIALLISTTISLGYNLEPVILGMPIVSFILLSLSIVFIIWLVIKMIIK